MGRILMALGLAAALCAAAQSVLVWQPPTLNYPDALPKATVPNEIITKLRVANMQILLEKTPLNDVEKHLGGTIGSRGDASEALAWLGFHGSDVNGHWALWLESSEMGGGTVDGFALQRIPKDAIVDRRCRTQDVHVELPVQLGIGSTESDVQRTLGAPTAKYRDVLIFYHEHEEKVSNETFTAANSVDIELRGSVVQTIQVWKTTSN